MQQPSPGRTQSNFRYLPPMPRVVVALLCCEGSQVIPRCMNATHAAPLYASQGIDGVAGGVSVYACNAVVYRCCAALRLRTKVCRMKNAGNVELAAVVSKSPNGWFSQPKKTFLGFIAVK